MLDYRFYLMEKTVELLLTDADRRRSVKLRKGQYDDIGLQFETYLMDKQQRCANNCIFCFVDQMPGGLRESLYFKDDDARLSFLFGNYVTLTNLRQQDIDRIIAMHISPINVSVHTTDPALRCQMMGNRFAGEKLAYLRQLADGGIRLNTQLVLCPGINDGAQLDRSLHDLGALGPAVQSIALVPVGLTKYREGLYPLRPYTATEAAAVIDQADAFALQRARDGAERIAWAADEFYLRAGRPIPDADCYGAVSYTHLDVYKRQIQAIRQADLLMVGGTSLTVYPAAGLIGYREGGCKLALLNRTPTPYDGEADLVLHGSIGDILGALRV